MVRVRNKRRVGTKSASSADGSLQTMGDEKVHFQTAVFQHYWPMDQLHCSYGISVKYFNKNTYEII